MTARLAYVCITVSAEIPNLNRGLREPADVPNPDFVKLQNGDWEPPAGFTVVNFTVSSHSGDINVFLSRVIESIHPYRGENQ